MESRFSSFLTELKRRKVTRVAVAYAIVGIGVAEAADLFLLRLPVPAWTVDLVVILIVLGFPIALVLAWALEVTPTGIQRTPEASPQELENLAHPWWSLVRWGTFGAGLVAVAFVAYFAFFRPPPPAPGPPRIAVFPLENLTGTPALDDLGKAAAYHITRGLSWAEVQVVPTDFVAKAMDRRSEGDSDREIAELLQATVLVTGAFSPGGDRLHFQAQIIDVATGDLIYPVEASGPATLEHAMEGAAELGERIMGGLAVSPDNVAARVMTQAPRYEAFRSLERGAEYFVEGKFEEAIPFLHQAYAQDSTFLPALIEALAGNLNLRRWAGADSLIRFLEARRDRLGPIERNSLEGLAAVLRGDHEGAYRAARSSLQYDPAGRGYFVAMYCVMVGRTEEALRALESVDYTVGWWREWGPLWWITSWAHQLAGNGREGLEFAREGRRRFPQNLVLRRLEVRALASLGRMGEVDPLLDQIHGLEPAGFEHEGGALSPGSVFLTVSGDFARRGYPEEALSVARRAVEWYRDDGSDAYRQELGEALLFAHQPEAALAHLSLLLGAAPDSVAAHGALGVALAQTGDREGAEAQERWLAELERPYLRGEHTLWRARIAAQFGEDEDAVRLLRQALGEGRVFYFFLSDLFLSSLWGQEPFEELVRVKG